MLEEDLSAYRIGVETFVCSSQPFAFPTDAFCSVRAANIACTTIPRTIKRRRFRGIEKSTNFLPGKFAAILEFRSRDDVVRNLFSANPPTVEV